MRGILVFLIPLTFLLAHCGQKYEYPGQLEIRNYKIGDKVDTALFKKIGDVYYPNYLDGWNIDNYDKLPDKYARLPIAMWQLISDSSIALTLLKDTILNITVSFIKNEERDELINFFTKKFKGNPSLKSYEETHPLQPWITYWNLTTWETKDVIVQLGNGDMRKPEDLIPPDTSCNLTYSDFILENRILDHHKKED